MKYLKYFENHLTKTVCHYGMKITDNDLKEIFNTNQTLVTTPTDLSENFFTITPNLDIWYNESIREFGLLNESISNGGYLTKFQIKMDVILHDNNFELDWIPLLKKTNIKYTYDKKTGFEYYVGNSSDYNCIRLLNNKDFKKAIIDRTYDTVFCRDHLDDHNINFYIPLNINNIKLISSELNFVSDSHNIDMIDPTDYNQYLINKKAKKYNI
ncbi:hypothetical protein M0Q97_10625 [Candidatus Dojkabacteria bacterium]|jgi:hypothetical protein|nr:hypothetical protein [Candidatus Dojkabacteria bacterium]